MEKVYKFIAIAIFSIAYGHHGFAQIECLEATWELSPTPVDGAYEPGQVVQMCVTITDYNPSNGNSIHGIIPVLPEGWDLFSITPQVAPASCSGTGTWQWYQSIISGSDNQVYGPGYFFNTGTDNIPGNNFGDLCTNYNLNFCISVTLRVDCGGAGNQLNMEDITPGFRITTDGQSGNWNSASDCEDAMTYPDDQIHFACCSAVSGNATGPVLVCGTDPIDLNSYLEGADAGGSWSNAQTGVALPGGIFTPFENQGGLYRYTVTDQSCVSYTNVEVNTSYNPNAGTSSSAEICITDAPFNLATLLNGMPNPGGVWTNENGDVINGTPFDPATNSSGQYVYTVTGGPLCPLDTSATLDLTINICPGIEETVVAKVEVYPNPVDEVLNITLDRPLQNAQVYIFDLLGREVFHLNQDLEEKFELTIGTLQPGLYILQIKSEDFDVSKKFTKQ